jgi:hypothetical protein
MTELALAFGVTTVWSWLLVVLVWHRYRAIEAKLHEPSIVNQELLRLLAGSYAAARALLEACPAAELHGRCATRRSALAVAVAAVEEFAPSSDGDG